MSEVLKQRGPSSTGQDNLVVGYNTHASHDRCVVFGDECCSSKDDDIVVGDTIFGQPIPDDVQDMVREHPKQLYWVLHLLADQLNRLY